MIDRFGRLLLSLRALKVDPDKAAIGQELPFG
jgi:hypothetical protein